MRYMLLLPMGLLIKILSTGEYWRTEAVRKYRYEGVDVIDVAEDVRPTTSTTTTTTTTAP